MDNADSVDTRGAVGWWRRATDSPVLRGIIAAILVAASGRMATPQVWILTVVSGLSFFGLAHREYEQGEAETEDWTSWLIQGSFLIVLCAAAWDSQVARPFFELPGPIEIIGLIILGLGVELRRRTVAIMGERFTIRVVLQPEHQLVTDGPFELIRHPSYASLGLMALGTAIALLSPLAGLATVFIWLPSVVIRIHQEEKALHEELGDVYREYARKTWRMIPWIY